jgi:hypothetical protein
MTEQTNTPTELDPVEQNRLAMLEEARRLLADAERPLFENAHPPFSVFNNQIEQQ